MAKLTLVNKPVAWLGAYFERGHVYLKWDTFEIEMTINEVSLMLNDICDADSSATRPADKAAASG